MTDYDWASRLLKGHFCGDNHIERLRIASAFLSDYGLELLKDLVTRNHITKSNVEIYLSREFSLINAGRILKELDKIATVYIFLESNLHAKAYLFEDKDGNADFFNGSANCTKGGFENNTEFVTYQRLSEDGLTTVRSFYECCKKQSVPLTAELIRFYDEHEQSLNKLKVVQEGLKRNFKKFINKNDPFQKNTYNLNQFFFEYEDYELFFPRNEGLTTSAMKARRKTVQDKMLELHKQIKNQMNQLNLHSHWSSKNTTSLIDPSLFNHNKVSWMGVRYGKSKAEIDLLNVGLNHRRNSYGTDGEYTGFQKHACIQFTISASAFGVSFFFAVPHEAIDRSYIQDFIDRNDQEKLNSIVKQLGKLKGNGFVWTIEDGQTGELIDEFEFDQRNINDFWEFFKQDEEGRISYCGYFVEPDEPVMKDVKSIINFIIEKTKLLYPVYTAMTFRQ